MPTTDQKTATRLIAVVEIGSTGIRLLIAHILPDGLWQELDRAGKPVSLGRDVFTSGQVSRESLLECVSVLRNFQELLGGWGIKDVHVIATSALRAARNRDVFVDRVRRETGFLLNIVEGIEENRLMYLAVRFALKQDLAGFFNANTMIIDIGGGSTELMLLRKGKMAAAHSLRLGTIFMGLRSSSLVARERYVSENIRSTSGFLSAEMDLSHVRTFVAVGPEIRTAATLIGTEINEHCRTMTREDFSALVDTLRDYSIEECVGRLNLSYTDVEGLAPALLVYRQFLEQTSALEVVAPDVSIREGLLIDLALGIDADLQAEFFSQIIASAANLGRKYHYDEQHSRLVADLCLSLFDALHEHGMSRQERMMLEVAALLHDIGMFIAGDGHQRHGQYIVSHAEIFGLHRDELGIIANVIRYHRGRPPSSADIDYMTLSREERILVLKMASILRVADALDRGHSQHIRKIRVERKRQTLALHTEGEGAHDLSLELAGLEEKADMFQDVYGYKVILL
jgi:exopolyphosphatase/guanosine-5'-triphosphate,3'-diphosphate pyrophosphatase